MAKECYPEEVGVKEISEKSVLPRDNINQTIRNFYNKRYSKCPEKYPVIIEKKKIRVIRTGKSIGQNHSPTAWRIKWRPSDAGKM